MELGIIEKGSTLGALKIKPSAWAPGIWAGMEGASISFDTGRYSCRLVISAVDFKNRIIYTVCPDEYRDRIINNDGVRVYYDK